MNYENLSDKKFERGGSFANLNFRKLQNIVITSWMQVFTKI